MFKGTYAYHQYYNMYHLRNDSCTNTEKWVTFEETAVDLTEKVVNKLFNYDSSF